MPWPSQPSQRPPRGVEARSGSRCSRACALRSCSAKMRRISSQKPMYVAGQERGVLPIGVWSTSSTRSTLDASDRAAADQIAVATSCCRSACIVLADEVLQFVYSTSRATVDLPEPDTPVTTTSRPSGTRTSTSCAGCAARCARSSSAACACRRRGAAAAGCASGSRRNRPVIERGLRMRSVDLAFARRSRRRARRRRARGRCTCSARRMVSSSCSTTTSVLPLRCELRRANRAGSRCRADAGRSSARPGCSTRRAGSSRAARRAGCAALRRPTASAPSDRAPDSRGRPARRNSRRARSSASRSRAISLLARLRASASQKNFASVFDRLRGRSRRSMFRSRKRTPSASGLRRLPFARGAGLVDLEPLDPRVEHVVFGAGLLRSSSQPTSSIAGRCRSTLAHQPCFELNENRRGSSSGKLRPHEGHARLVENTVHLVGFGPSTCTTPLPNSSARASASRSCVSRSSRRPRARATGSSIVCSLKRSRRGHGRVGSSSPSTRRCL